MATLKSWVSKSALTTAVAKASNLFKRSGPDGTRFRKRSEFPGTIEALEQRLYLSISATPLNETLSVSQSSQVALATFVDTYDSGTPSADYQATINWNDPDSPDTGVHPGDGIMVGYPDIGVLHLWLHVTACPLRIANVWQKRR